VNHEASAEGPKKVLFVDLDGTLIASDLLWEAFFRALKQKPWIALLAPLWLLRGRAALKQGIAQHATPDPASLPYRDDVLGYLRERKGDGVHVVLATASHHSWAHPVATHLDLFDDVLATTAERNLKGRNKLAAIQDYCLQRGAISWGYMGDAHADLPIWAAADEVHVVAPSPGLLGRVRAQRSGDAPKVFGNRVGWLRPALKAMRPHQWVKNILLFVPLLLSRQYTEPSKLLAVVIAFAAFSLCASSVYLFNDLLDVDADRIHPRKRKRPFASGALPLVAGPPMAFGLVTLAFALALTWLPMEYVAVQVLYMIVTSAYSASLKSKLLVDVFILAGLYTLRIFAGGVAAELAVSEWLLAFSIFMFTSLAFAKRYVEMSRLQAEGKTTARGRGYEVGDIPLIETLGATSGYLAVLVFALYIHDGVPAFYTQKSLLWLTCPLLLFWISRLWFLAKRGELNDDPVVFAVTDRVSLGVGFVVGLLVLFSAPWW